MKRRPVEVRVSLPYTLDAANKTLPLVRRIVDDLSHRYADWQDALSKLGEWLISAKVSPGENQVPMMRAMKFFGGATGAACRA